MKKIIIKLMVFLMMQFATEAVGSSGPMIGSVQHAPNPFRLTSGTTVVYELREAVPIEFIVYNQFGHQISSMRYEPGMDGARKGKNLVKFDRRHFSGNHLSNGVLFYVLSSNGHVLGKGKMAIIQ